MYCSKSVLILGTSTGSVEDLAVKGKINYRLFIVNMEALIKVSSQS